MISESERLTTQANLGGPSGALLTPLAVGLALAAVAFALVAFGVVERRWRARWTTVPLDRRALASGPYRRGFVVTGHHRRAPALVRATALSALVFTVLFCPTLLVALTSLPFDGIAIALWPACLSTLAVGACGLSVLYRSSVAATHARLVALVALISNVVLLVLCGIHLGFVEYDANYGIGQASTTAPGVTLVFVLASTIVAVLLLAMIRAHRGALEWRERDASSCGA